MGRSYKAMVTGLAVLMLAGCAATDGARLDYYALKFRHECFGAGTVECRALRVKHNVLAFRKAVDETRAARATALANLDQDDFDAGIQALEAGGQLQEDDRPGLLSRWILGSRQTVGPGRLPELLVSTSDTEQTFVLGVIAHREKAGKPLDKVRRLMGQAGDAARVDQPASDAGSETTEDAARRAAMGAASQAAQAEAINGTVAASRPHPASTEEDPPEAYPAAEVVQAAEANGARSDDRRTSDPSFQCAKAATSAEHMVCASETLAVLDRRVSQAYANARTRGVDPVQLRRSQREWLGARDACGAIDCMVTSYNDRLTQLAQLR